VYSFHSFTTPTKFLSKLIERYRVPQNVTPTDRDVIHMRVCIALKLWISRSIQDFDPADLFAALNDFIDNTVAHDHKELANTLRKQIETQLSLQRQRHEALLAVPPQVYYSTLFCRIKPMTHRSLSPLY